MHPKWLPIFAALALSITTAEELADLPGYIQHLHKELEQEPFNDVTVRFIFDKGIFCLQLYPPPILFKIAS